MSIKKFRIFFIIGSLLILIALIFLLQGVIVIYKSKAFEGLEQFKTQKQMDVPIPTVTPTVCNCDQCQVRIK